MALPTHSQDDCRTPRRNRDVGKALDFFDGLSAWCDRVDRYLIRMMQFEQNARPSHDGFFPKRDLGAINIKVRHLLGNLCTHKYRVFWMVCTKHSRR